MALTTCFCTGFKLFLQISSNMLRSVVQGSVLGPILFLLFVNDICDLAYLGVTIKLFADDTKLYCV